MTRLEKAELLKFKGYTYNSKTGKIFGVKGKHITSKNKDGYVMLSAVNLLGHHFAWYMTYGNVDFIMLDHINRDKKDNRISNLRISTNSENQFNKKSKGYSWNKNSKKWKSYIGVNNKLIHLGYFKTKKEARESYLKAKKIHHII
jgi:hypothetical protein